MTPHHPPRVQTLEIKLEPHVATAGDDAEPAAAPATG
jgi:hypothetical protein